MKTFNGYEIDPDFKIMVSNAEHSPANELLVKGEFAKVVKRIKKQIHQQSMSRVKKVQPAHPP